MWRKGVFGNRVSYMRRHFRLSRKTLPHIDREGRGLACIDKDRLFVGVVVEIQELLISPSTMTPSREGAEPLRIFKYCLRRACEIVLKELCSNKAQE